MTVVLFTPWVTAHTTTFITGLTAALSRLVLGVNSEVESRVGTDLSPYPPSVPIEVRPHTK